MDEKYKLELEDILVARALLQEFQKQKENKKVITTYENICNIIDRKSIQPHNVGSYLGKVSTLCYDILDLPFISAIVVSQTDAKPGEGFYKMIREKGYITKEEQDSAIQQARLNKDWTKLEKYLNDNWGKNQSISNKFI